MRGDTAPFSMDISLKVEFSIEPWDAPHHSNQTHSVLGTVPFPVASCEV